MNITDILSDQLAMEALKLGSLVADVSHSLVEQANRGEEFNARFDFYDFHLLELEVKSIHKKIQLEHDVNTVSKINDALDNEICMFLAGGKALNAGFEKTRKDRATIEKELCALNTEAADYREGAERILKKYGLELKDSRCVTLIAQSKNFQISVMLSEEEGGWCQGKNLTKEYGYLESLMLKNLFGGKSQPITMSAINLLRKTLKAKKAETEEVVSH